MSKRPFLDAPAAWTRTRRTGATSIDEACALQAWRRSGRAWHDWALLVGLAGFVALMLIGAA